MELPTPYVPTEEAKKLYGDFIAEVNKRELAGSDNFDKSILTLSSAGLGLSLSFLKDIGCQLVQGQWILYMSWCSFVLATLSTMASFLVSAKAMDFQRALAHRAYVEGDVNAFDEPNKWDRWTRRLNLFSAAAFFLALVLTIVFVILNVEGRKMTTNSNKPAPSHGTVQKGFPVPTMQRPSAPAPAPASSPAPPSAPSNGSSKG